VKSVNNQRRRLKNGQKGTIVCKLLKNAHQIILQAGMGGFKKDSSFIGAKNF